MTADEADADRQGSAAARASGGKRKPAAKGGRKGAAEPASAAASNVPATSGRAESVAEGTAAGAAAGEGDFVVTPSGILEAMLFRASGPQEPLPPEKAASLMRGVEPAEIHTLVAELNARYQATNRPYHIVGRGTGYSLELREEFRRLRDKMLGKVRRARLSQAAIDILALVGYRQPLALDDIDKLRGKPSGALVRQLVRRGLLRVQHTESTPRKTLYYTTRRFLELLELESLEDLPRSQDLDRE